MDGLVPEIVQRVVHPAHVPLEVEAKPAAGDAGGHAGPRGGFFGDGQRTGAAFVDHGVQFAQEVDGFQVFPAAETVRHPLAGLAAVVAVEHGCHRVHAQAVGMEVLQPVQRAG
ncbi:hypothetical protein D9M72_468280 [compost metagenome]